MSRDPEAIQREIEQTRDELASTLDQLAERTSPKRLADVGRQRVMATVTSPPALAAIGAVTLLVAVGVARRVRRTRSARR